MSDLDFLNLFETTDENDLFGFALQEDQNCAVGDRYTSVVVENGTKVEDVGLYMEYTKIGKGTLFKTQENLSWKGNQEYVFPVSSILQVRQKVDCEIKNENGTTEITTLIHIELAGCNSVQFCLPS